MASGKPALVLLHALSMSGSIWRNVVPLLSEDFQVYTPTALGHRGGPHVQLHPVTATALVDWGEGYLVEQGLDRPHLAGNSIGGLIAIELARRGRAASVCALSPPGFWSSAHDPSRLKAMKLQRRNVTMARYVRPIAPLPFRSAAFRRTALRDSICHGDRLTAAQSLEIMDDSNACTVNEVFASVEPVAPLDPLPCPITLAWAERDAFFPVDGARKVAHDRLPAASFIVLPGVGHVAPIDDPRLVAQTMLAATRA